ncbi:MAG: chemotaxis protein CheA [Clostridium sp.]|uniref:chemotaxis protein CheA n=1 Tax=Clostridium sp. TaxID=1506 RepID=UPI003EE4A5D1
MEASQYMMMFLEEAIENLQRLNEAVLELEKNPKDSDIMNKIFRWVHTIKGMSATMGFIDIAELTHKMEDLVSDFREGKTKVNQTAITSLFECLDTLEKMLENIRDKSNLNIDISEIMKKLEKIKKSKYLCENIKVINRNNLILEENDLNKIKEGLEKGYNSLEVKIILNKNTVLKSVRAFLIYQDLEGKCEFIKINPSIEQIEKDEFDFMLEAIILTSKSIEEIRESIEKNVDIANVDIIKFNLYEKNIIKKSNQSVKVDLDKVDNFMNMVSELTIYRTRLESISRKHRINELSEVVEQIGKATSDLQELVMDIRMLPLEVVFKRFPRMIRDVSIELGKNINFMIEGSHIELDRTVIDEIGELLIHLLRNAIDHGIEEKSERLKIKKNPIGIIKLQAWQEGTKVIIKVTDDGAGINLDKIKKKAENMGISIKGMSIEEINNIIFIQGFSTNDRVTEISGRGIGMDIVKTKVTSLGGSIELRSKEGIGSEFTIVLPLTLQIIQALLIKVENERFAISLGVIERIIPYNKKKVISSDREKKIIYKEKEVPIIKLSEKLNIESENEKFIIIVNTRDKRFGIVVSSLIGEQEIVIKPLGKTLKRLNQYSGATILGDGLVTLILDVGALY